MQLRSELVVLCVRQSEENEPENDLNEKVLLFSETTSEEILPVSSCRFGFTTLRTLGVASTSSSPVIVILPNFETSSAAISVKVSNKLMNRGNSPTSI